MSRALSKGWLLLLSWPLLAPLDSFAVFRKTCPEIAEEALVPEWADVAPPAALRLFVAEFGRLPRSTSAAPFYERRLSQVLYRAINAARIDPEELSEQTKTLFKQRKFFHAAAVRAHEFVENAEDLEHPDVLRQVKFWREFGVNLLEESIEPLPFPPAGSVPGQEAPPEDLALALNAFVKEYGRWPRQLRWETPAGRLLYRRAYEAVRTGRMEIQRLRPRTIRELKRMPFFTAAARRAHKDLQSAPPHRAPEFARLIEFWRHFGVDLRRAELKLRWPTEFSPLPTIRSPFVPEPSPEPVPELKPELMPPAILPKAASKLFGPLELTPEGEEREAARVAEIVESCLLHRQRFPLPGEAAGLRLERALAEGVPFSERLEPATARGLKESAIYRQALHEFYEAFFAERFVRPQGELPPNLERRLRLWQGFDEGTQLRDEPERPWFGVKVNAYRRAKGRLFDPNEPGELEDASYLVDGLENGAVFLSAIDQGSLLLLKQGPGFPALHETFLRDLAAFHEEKKRDPEPDSPLGRRLAFFARLGFSNEDTVLERRRRADRVVKAFNEGVSRRERPTPRELRELNLVKVLQEADPALKFLRSEAKAWLRGMPVYRTVFRDFADRLTAYAQRRGVEFPPPPDSPLGARFRLHAFLGENLLRYYPHPRR